MPQKIKQQKTLKDLTIKDNFMFAAVMMNSRLCRAVLERILGIPIDHVEVSTEKSIVYHPEYKGIRLDAYAKDAQGSRYDIEMQVVNQKIERRARYYHSQMDMDVLLSGSDYESLSKSFVIFICDFDPFGLGKYCYTLEKHFREESGFRYDDGQYTVFLNTHGKNRDEIDPKLAEFLSYIRNPETYPKENVDTLIVDLQKSVSEIKNSRELGERYMLLEIMLRDERREGRAEGLAEGREAGLAEGREAGLAEGREAGLAEGREAGLAEAVLLTLGMKGEVTENLRTYLTDIQDPVILRDLLQKAINAASVQEFEQYMKLKTAAN